MAYCVAGDVTALSGVAYSTTSTPTAEQVGAFIDEVAGEIGIALDAIGVASTTGASIAAVLKKYNAMGAACLAFQRTADNPDEFQRAEAMCDKNEAWLLKLIDDDKYQAILKGNSIAMGNYVSNQVVDGTTAEADVSFMDEGFSE